MSQINHPRFTSIWIGASIILAISISLFFEAFNRFDRWIYDEATQTAQIYYSTAPQVLLVELDAGFDGLSVENWFKLLKQINQHQPAAIVINIYPWNWSEADFQRAASRYPLIIGTTQPDPNFAYSTIPPLDGSTYRQQRQQLTINGNIYKTLESVVAGKVNRFQADTANEYFINFMGGVGSLPTVSSQRVMDGGLVDALVKNRVVLIGIKFPMMLDVSSPLGMMPYASYQAFALETLLNNNAIKMADFWLVLLLVLLLVFVILLAAFKIPDRYQLIFFICFLFLTLSLSYLGLIVFRNWFMPGYLLITEFSLFIAMLFLRNRQNQQALQTMALNSAARIESHWLSESFYSSDTHWNHIANMVTQTLSLERTIFLERVEGDHRVREIKAVNCSINDIGELRRDYQRTPYTTAIEYAGALKLKHTYLEATDDDEDQYLMPLNFAGNIQGFWAFTIKQNIELDEDKLVDAVEQFAIQISELLYHRAEWEKNQQTQQRFVIKLMQMNFEENAYDSINRSINFLTHRLSIMETLMDGLETLAILYDLFGRVIHVNKSMTQMLTENKLLPYSMSAVDLIVSLSGCSMTEARNYLSYLILDKGSINIPVKKDGIKTGYMMIITALKNNTDYEAIEDEIKPFEIIGILCELIDMSQIRELYTQKEKIVQHMSGWLKNDLSSISMACDLSQDSRISDEKRSQLLQLIKLKVKELGTNFEQVNEIVQKDLVSKITSQYPVDYVESLQIAIKDSKKKHNKNIAINPDIPFCSPLVMAAPKELRQVFIAIFNVLITDSVDESEILAKINCDKERVDFEFINQGFGLPQEQLQSYLQSTETLDNEEFQMLKEACNQITNWNGEFTVNSEIGEGIRFQFFLKAFEL